MFSFVRALPQSGRANVNKFNQVLNEIPWHTLPSMFKDRVSEHLAAYGNFPLLQNAASAVINLPTEARSRLPNAPEF